MTRTETPGTETPGTEKSGADRSRTGTHETGVDAGLLPTASRARVWAVLLDLLRPHRRTGFLALVALLAAAATGLLTAPTLGRIVDVAADGRGAAAVTGPVLVLVAVALVQGAVTVLGVTLVARVGEGALATLRERFVDRALALPLERIERAGSGDLTSRATADVAQVGEAARDAVPRLAQAGMVVVLTLVGLAALDWRFLVAALPAVPVQVVTARWFLRRSGPIYAAQRRAGGAQQQQLLDTVGGAATVRAFRLADVHTAKVRSRSDEVVRLALDVVRFQTRFFGRLNAAEFIGVAAVLTTGFLLVRDGSATIGTASAAALYFINLFGPINQLLFLLDTAQSAAASLSRIVGVVDVPVRERPTVPDTPLDAGVELSGVEYAYVPGHPVLSGVSLRIEPGRRVALVGASGSGKTTVAKLVAGVHEPGAGSVRVGGVSVADLGPDVTTMISQEVHVFAGPLADDLRLARPEATDDELRAALARVEALDWVDSLEAGLDTVVGGGGHRLTVVQAQQLALARLVLADRPLAVLDEATAEAGSAGSQVLERAARAALAGRTGLVVAHRLNQAAEADRIVVLDDGRVVEQGTHAELVTAGGRYAALWSAWSDERPEPGTSL